MMMRCKIDNNLSAFLFRFAVIFLKLSYRAHAFSAVTQSEYTIQLAPIWACLML